LFRRTIVANALIPDSQDPGGTIAILEEGILIIDPGVNKTDHDSAPTFRKRRQFSGSEDSGCVHAGFVHQCIEFGDRGIGGGGERQLPGHSLREMNDCELIINKVDTVCASPGKEFCRTQVIPGNKICVIFRG